MNDDYNLYTTTQTNDSYENLTKSDEQLVGYYIAPLVFALLVWGIGYAYFRLVKHRKPNAKETKVLVIVGVCLAIFGVISNYVQHNGNY